MANSASAKKRIRQNEKHRALNKAEKTRLRTQLKKFQKALEAKDKAVAQKEFIAATQLLDRASKHRLIHDNQASRRKSRMQLKLNALVAG
ncbi:MAG: 30S ribosomal protein S20 [Planctomycetota bacterium]